VNAVRGIAKLKGLNATEITSSVLFLFGRSELSVLTDKCLNSDQKRLPLVARHSDYGRQLFFQLRLRAAFLLPFWADTKYVLNP
jgi:hypothetical protein